MLVRLAELALLPLALLVSIRIFHLDSTQPTVMLVTFLPWLLVPAWLLLGIGIGARRRRLVVGALVIVIVHVSWTAAEIPWNRSLSAAAAEAPTLDVMSANVFRQNPHPEDIFDEVVAAQPDVVILVEMEEFARARLRVHPLSAQYRYTWSPPRQPDVIMLSRLPFVETGQLKLTRELPWVRVDVGGVAVTVLGVHTVNATKSTTRWERDLAAIDDWSESVSGPLVMAGDFNATTQHRQFRALLDNGTEDAHLEQGAGWGATWPARSLVGPFLRIDHILVRGDAETVRFWRGIGKGSDHRPVRASIAIL